ncbi:MAG: helix-turn-helix domain containing protein [Candidatus Taylorbacteria bacterium]|nr:helix-turn-helix domain containing protein [Candidatus Taylorbacteria bacterium]
MKYKEKIKAIELRKQGKSIKEIAKILLVTKSSVSLWVRNIVLTKEMLEHLKENQYSFKVIENRRQARLINENDKRESFMIQAGKDIHSISYEKLKIVGAILYWAEGGKTKRYIRFSNSDPNIILVMMKFLRIVCKVKEEKFRFAIHTHSHLNANNAEKYWSKIVKISLSQFYKTYSKPSIASKFKKDSLPFGTLDITVCDVNVFLRVMGWIRKISNLTQKL